MDPKDIIFDTHYKFRQNLHLFECQNLYLSKIRTLNVNEILIMKTLKVFLKFGGELASLSKTFNYKRICTAFLAWRPTVSWAFWPARGCEWLGSPCSQHSTSPRSCCPTRRPCWSGAPPLQSNRAYCYRLLKLHRVFFWNKSVDKVWVRLQSSNNWKINSKQNFNYNFWPKLKYFAA